MGKIDINKLILGILILAFLIYVVQVFKPKEPTLQIPSQVEQLFEKKDSLDIEMKNDNENIKNKIVSKINNTKKQNEKQIKEIIDIPNLDRAERDSIWSIILTDKDSLPTRYWNILEQRARRQSNRNF